MVFIYMIMINYYSDNSGGMLYYIDGIGRKVYALTLPECRNRPEPPQDLEEITDLTGWAVVDPAEAAEEMTRRGCSLMQSLILR